MQDKNQDKFLILDGNAVLHRAFHALPPLTTKKGQPIGAVYGFFSMFLKLIQEIKPSYLAVCFDRPKPTFRKQLFVGYQAKRPAMAEELTGQIKIVHEILKQANIAIFEIDGFEADDVIGTLAREASVPPSQNSTRQLADKSQNKGKLGKSKDSLETIIVSGDRDMLQLVTPQVKILMPIIGITQMILYDEEKVKEKYEIEPIRIVDYKALAGDASDNYGGVPGVGPKTAISLIKKYGELDEIYKNLDIIKKENPLLAKRLTENYDSAILARTLAKIVQDVPLVFDISDCHFGRLDKENLKKIFEDYSFKSLLKRFNEIFGKDKAAEKVEKKASEKENQLKLLN